MNEYILSWSHLLGNAGFPIGVAFYLLMRFEKKINNLSDTILRLVEAIRN
ncbi:MULTISPECIES: YvrJ family protein [unclassified Paenibacillus]